MDIHYRIAHNQEIKDRQFPEENSDALVLPNALKFNRRIGIEKFRESYHLVGYHPILSIEEIKPGACINIYTDLYRGIGVLNAGWHSLVHAAYCSRISDALSNMRGSGLKEVENDLLGDSMVAGFVARTDQGVIVSIRPDREAELLLRALKVLEQCGIPRASSRFLVGHPAFMEEVKLVGCFHLIENAHQNNPDEVSQFLSQNYIKRISTENDESSGLSGKLTKRPGNTYFRVRSRGEWLLTPDLLEQLASDLRSRSKVLKCLGEVVEKYAQRSMTTGERDVDFLLVNSDLGRVKDTSFLYERLQEVYENVLSLKEWGEKEQSAVKEDFASLVAKYRQSTHELFYHDNWSDPQWRTIMYAFLRGLFAKEDLERLGREYSGAYEILAGGMVGYDDGSDYPKIGAEQITLEQAIARYGDNLDKRALLKTGHICIELQQTDGVNQLLRLDLEQPASGKIEIASYANKTVEVRSFLFRPEATITTRDLLNVILREESKLKYAYACNVSFSLATRDAWDYFVKHYWDAPRRVFIVGFKAGDQKERKLLVRRSDSPSYFFEHIYNGGMPHQDAIRYARAARIFQQAQRVCANMLGAGAADISSWLLKENIPEIGVINVEYLARDFVQGEPVSRISRFKYPSMKYAVKFAQARARIGAKNIVERRRVDSDSDNFITSYDGAGCPETISLVDVTTAFPPCEVIGAGGLAADTKLYACHLAAEMAAVRFIAMKEMDGGFSTQPLFLPSSSQIILREYLDSFARELASLKHECLIHEEQWLKRVDELYAGEENVPDDFDIRSRWRRALSDLKQCVPEDIVSGIREDVKPLYELYNYALHGIVDSRDAESLILELEDMLAANWSDYSVVNMDRLVRVFLGDSNFNKIEFEEREYRIHICRASAWLNRFSISLLKKVLPVARECFEGCGGEFETARNVFAKRISEELAPVRLQFGMAEKIFSAWFAGGQYKQRQRDLIRKDYYLERLH